MNMKRVCGSCLCGRRLLSRSARHGGSDASLREGESPLRRLVEGATTYREREPREPALQWATQPYATAGAPPPAAERLDPRHYTVLLFPGQGSQYVGMGKDLLKFPAAKQLYEFASSVVGWDVLRVCTQGPEEELRRRAQTCVAVTSLAALERAREERPGALEAARAAAGLSLGELTALAWAGALEAAGALRLVELRAAAMAAAAAERPGGMLTVWLAADAELGALLTAAREAARAAGETHPLADVANYLYANCKVLAGSEQALQFVERQGRRYGVRRSARLAVEGACHSAAMERARTAVRAAVRASTVRAPRVAVLCGAEARPYRDADHIRRALPQQLVRPVRWEQTLHALYARAAGEHFPRTLALGPGGEVRATLRQVNAKAWDTCVQIHA